jgi:mono/diheme cytochrome c family protein
MRSPFVGSLLAPGLAAALLAAVADAQPKTQVPQAWPGCCGLTPWAQGGPMRHRREFGGRSGYAYIVGGSALRHHLGVTGQIPARYAKLRNPIPPTPQNAQSGAAVYEAHCSACHGATGLGDGPASRGLAPPPAELAWLAKVPTRLRDSFMYWSIADGGRTLKTDMPSYRGKLTDEEIWSVIGYVQARLPEPKGGR